MATSERVGTVSGLWRFPVKSMQGERLERVEFTARGLLGDRAHALMDVGTGKVVSAKNVRQFPDVLGCQATFVEPPQPGQEVPAVRIELPGGASVASDAADLDQILSAHLQREVTLARSAPEDLTTDMYHPDVEDLDPQGHRDVVVEQKLGSAFFAQAGYHSAVPVGSFFDLFPVSVLATSTLRRLSQTRPASRFDERRFRMNVTIDTAGPGFLENDWVGHQLCLGDTARIEVALPGPRCVMTTLAQGDLPRDTDILRTLVRHNRVQVVGAGPYPCAGAYAVVVTPGTVRTGDRVHLIRRTADG